MHIKLHFMLYKGDNGSQCVIFRVCSDKLSRDIELIIGSLEYALSICPLYIIDVI